MMNRENILHLADLNLADFVREMARWNAAGEILEHNDLLLTKGAGRFPSTSVALNLSANASPSAAQVYDRIDSFYRERQSGFSIHIRKHADAELETICRQKKLFRASDAPGMMIDKPFPGKKAPVGIEIRGVADVSGVAAFAVVVIESYQSLGMPPYIGEKIFASPERLLKPYNYFVVAYDQGQPVSAAMLVFSPAVAGIYWVGTVTGARGKGLAEACVRTVTNEAFSRGARLVVLQASKFGEPVYRRMGFEEITRYPWYLYFKQT